jgi:hypothetical protein
MLKQLDANSGPKRVLLLLLCVVAPFLLVQTFNSVQETTGEFRES